MRKLFLLIVLSIYLTSCSEDISKSTKAAKDRPHNPWVFRSVLDQMPRMITIALDSNAWIAYHTDKASMYKVWDGGVSFEGAVYDYAHGPQPSSYGYAYSDNSDKSVWSISNGNEKIQAKVNYKGHRIKDDRVYLNYELSDGETTIKVSESPEVILNKKGNRILNRTFEINGLKGNQKLSLNSKVSSVVMDAEIETNATWEKVSEAKSNFEAKNYLDISGNLVLKNGSSYFNVNIDKATIADQNAVEAALVEESGAPLGLKLIAKNDCKTCHNRKVKTIGPSYTSIAKKYNDTKANYEMLTAKVVKGGSGIWGEEVMNAHPNVAESDIKEMVKYILSLANPGKQKTANEQTEWITAKTEIKEDQLIPGSIVKVWEIEQTNKYPKNIQNKTPLYAGVLPNYDNISGSDFTELNENFALEGQGFLHIPKDGKYAIRIWSDDGSLLYLHDKLIIDNDGLHGPEYGEAILNLKEGYHPFRIEFFQAGGGKFLSFNYKPEDSPSFEVIPVGNIYHTSEQQKSLQGKTLPMAQANKIPGDKNLLTEVHPSFDVYQAKPEEFKPKVGGLDFMSDGTCVISTWDPEGPVYLIKNPTAENPEDIEIKKIASGFAEPLGLKVVNDQIYIMQKQELTKLIDHDGDEIIDEYLTLCDDWGVTANFHEFGFGLDYVDGYFYATLATGIMPGGASMLNQHKDRGSAIKIAEDGSNIEFIANGLRTPNGIGVGYNGEMFVADNQGDWLPASKIVHVTKDAWFGSRSVDYTGTAKLKEKKPVVWLPQDEIGNSPSTPSYIDVGPYKGQMIHGEVTNGGVKRVFVEEVNGELQGVVFRFIQGLDAGINRLRWAPDGSLYVGGIGNPGNWAQSGKKWYGLQRLVYNEESTFEMLAVRAKSNGVEIEFTEPIRSGEGWLESDYEVKQWYYLPTKEYGGPKLDEKSLDILSVNVSEDRKKVFLELDGMKEDHVIYIHLKNKFISDLDHSLWSTEAWYTMNQIPSGQPGFKTQAPAPAALNSLTEEEKSDGWELLFDGKSLSNFRNFKKETIGSSWVIDDGAIHLNAIREEGKWQAKDGGDIITNNTYENFDLRLEWKIGPCGNSGVFFNVVENEDFDYGWQTGPEMQILDNVCHPDTRYPTHRAGDLYDMRACKFVTVNPAGQWNKVRIVSNNGAVQFWLNGYRVVDFTLFSDEWKEMVSKSKFKDWKGFGEAKSGHISLQDHGDPVWFRNIKIKSL